MFCHVTSCWQESCTIRHFEVITFALLDAGYRYMWQVPVKRRKATSPAHGTATCASLSRRRRRPWQPICPHRVRGNPQGHASKVQQPLPRPPSNHRLEISWRSYLSCDTARDLSPDFNHTLFRFINFTSYNGLARRYNLGGPVLHNDYRQSCFRCHEIPGIDVCCHWTWLSIRTSSIWACLQTTGIFFTFVAFGNHLENEVTVLETILNRNKVKESYELIQWTRVLEYKAV